MNGLLDSTNTDGGLLQTKKPPIIGSVYGIYEREPFNTELEFFRKNIDIGGMATEDGMIITNPFSNLSKEELDAVKLNEASRVFMKNLKPTFALTKEQKNFLLENKSYKNASLDDQRATIAARILSGDPSVGSPTTEQFQFVEKLKKVMGISDE
jgi:hypothetical protein